MNTLSYDRTRKIYILKSKEENGGRFHLKEFNDNPIELNHLFIDICALRLHYIYCWNGAKLFADFDNWAIKKDLRNYETLFPVNSCGYRPRVTSECYSVRDGDQCYYTRRYWLKTINFKTGDRHFRLHGVTLINAENYFGGRDLEEIYNTFHVEDLGDALKKFNDKINKLTGGLGIFDPITEKPIFLTLGSISKAYYLKLKYPQYMPIDRLRKYQNDFPSDKTIERELRRANLLSGGIIYLKDTEKHYDLFKYDKVSLFPSIERNLPALGTPREIPIKDFDGTIDNHFEYIYIFKNLVLKRKPHMPSLYPPQEGYTGINQDIVEIENEALFHSLYSAYLKYYDVVDSQIDKIYRCKKIHDPAIKTYVDSLFKEKSETTDTAYYFIIKLILNNLHGKFAQNPVTTEFSHILNVEGKVERRSTGIKDNWHKNHFDYIRGAYIYSMARTKMLEDLCTIADEQEITAAEGHMPPYRLVDHLYYSDTDSAILDHPINLEGYVGNSLGKFKNEGEIFIFKAFAPKIYAYYPRGSYKDPVLRCAGAKSKEIINFYNFSKTSLDLIDFLSSNVKLPITILQRTPHGAEYQTQWRSLTHYGDFEEEKGEL